jgi:hypothetical protein
MKKLYILTVCLTIFFSVFSQSVVINATIDSTKLMIGEQTLIHIDIAANKEQQLVIPIHTDTIVTGVEVLNVSKIDTTDIGNGRVSLKYDYLVTSFDSALYLLPPFSVITGNDTVFSNQIALNVSTMDVDTESKKFYDIKEVIQPPFSLWDYISPWMLLVILLSLCLIAALVYIAIRLWQKKSIVPFQKEEVYVPPHIRAILGLDGVKEQKLWQQGKVKLYFSEITEIIRKYIVERFGIDAMEMTSGEILEKIKGYSEADLGYDNLKQLLILADFVKFAKFNPLPDENESSLMSAYLFVNNTKKEELITEEETKKEE